VDYKSAYYPESEFGGFTDVDGTIAFYLRVNSLIDPSSVVLDIGCGRGAYRSDPVPLRRELRIFRGKVKKITGIDVSNAAKENPFIDEFYLIEEDSRWPVEDESVDLCLADYTLEHVGDPGLFFSECQRVLKPGGHLCIRTTNQLSYLGLFSKLVPNKIHARLLSKVQDERKEEDVYITLYKCNTVRKIRQALSNYSFASYVVYGYESEPSYASFSRAFYLAAVMHQQFAPQIIKVGIFAFARK
jgi:ubiquinone/menaquinone biosynthesis C-methylase UbiE